MEIAFSVFLMLAICYLIVADEGVIGDCFALIYALVYPPILSTAVPINLFLSLSVPLPQRLEWIEAELPTAQPATQCRLRK
jgi:hypothetical protein